MLLIEKEINDQLATEIEQGYERQINNFNCPKIVPLKFQQHDVALAQAQGTVFVHVARSFWN